MFRRLPDGLSSADNDRKCSSVGQWFIQQFRKTSRTRRPIPLISSRNSSESRLANDRASSKRKKRKTSPGIGSIRGGMKVNGFAARISVQARRRRAESTYSDTRWTCRHIFDRSRTVDPARVPKVEPILSFLFFSPTNESVLTEEQCLLSVWISFVNRDPSGWRSKRTDETRGVSTVGWKIKLPMTETSRREDRIGEHT